MTPKLINTKKEDFRLPIIWGPECSRQWVICFSRNISHCLLHCWQILYLLSHWGSSSQYYNLFTQIPIVFPIMNRVIEIFFSCYYDILSYLNSQYCNFIVIIYPKGLSIHDQSLCIQKSGQLLEDFTFESLTLNLVMLLFGSVFKRLL